MVQGYIIDFVGLPRQTTPPHPIQCSAEDRQLIDENEKEPDVVMLYGVIGLETCVIIILLAALTKILSRAVAEDLLVVEQPAVIESITGTSVTINCTFRTQGLSFSVRWYLGCDKSTPLETLPSYRHRVTFQNLNRQLTLSNLTESDSGTYYCHVELANGKMGTGNGTRLEVSPRQCNSGNEKEPDAVILYGVIGLETCVIIILLAALTKILSRGKSMTSKLSKYSCVWVLEN
ncbi:natural cytotoxicity triggering receptor 3-like isoform X1 [Pelobates cultripes]|uniref:Natural cytotoxicity triggering receptor 3-like isoform X1 n=1 Tax=Pelobates cultripes TaxID=61616 RepID=A0AAD1T0P3_PELCU|nr:natural cytotoxicity triggering receptor 3-like isoform X1 [Pelobates cultripes]